MSTDLEPVTNSKYSAEEVDTALLSWLRLGNAEKAALELKIPSRTIYDFRRQYPNRFQHAAERHNAELEPIVLANAQALAGKAAEAALDAVEAAHKRIKGGKDDNPARSSKDLAFTMGIAVDKAMILQGRPNSIHEVRGDDDLLQALRHIGRARSEDDEPIPDVEVLDDDENDSSSDGFQRQLATSNARDDLARVTPS